MDRSDWTSRWQEGRTYFHQPEVTPFLERYAERVWGPEAAGPGRIYVPLCGKSLDMVFLAERGAEVLGVEYVEQAVREFFAERGLDPELEGGPPVRYAAGPYVLYAADFFDLGAERLGRLDGVFDRAALIALDAETRVRYAAHLAALLPAGSRSLLITLDYDQEQMGGPPFAVGGEEVRRLYGDRFEIEHLETREALPDRFREQGVTEMTESAWLLTRVSGSR